MIPPTHIVLVETPSGPSAWLWWDERPPVRGLKIILKRKLTPAEQREVMAGRVTAEMLAARHMQKEAA